MEITSNDIKEAIKKSGYLFEQQVSQVVSNIGLCGSVSTNWNYPDDETGKSREIDIMAGYSQTFASHLPLNKNERIYDNLEVVFLFECKNNFHPVVFFSREGQKSGGSRIVTGTPQKLSGSFLWGGDLAEELAKKPRRWIATQYAQVQEAKKSAKNLGNKLMFTHEGYHESINGLIKAANFYSKQHNAKITKSHLINERIQLCVIFPIIVLGGDFYECRIKNKDFNLIKKKSTIYLKGYFSNYIQGNFKIHVVNIEKLPEVLSEIKREIKRNENRIQEHIRKMRK